MLVDEVHLGAVTPARRPPGWRRRSGPCRSAPGSPRPPAWCGRRSTTSCRRSSGRCGGRRSWAGGLGPGQGAERLAARLEIGELVVGGAGRRQQHGRLAGAVRHGRRRWRHARRRPACRHGAWAPGRRDRPRSRRRPCRSGSRRGRCPAPGAGCVKPPGLGLPPAIQKMLAKLASDFSAELGLVALLSLTQSTRPARATSSIRCGRPRKLGKPGHRLRRRQAQRPDGGVGHGDVLPVVPPAQVLQRPQVEDLGPGLEQAAVAHRDLGAGLARQGDGRPACGPAPRAGRRPRGWGRRRRRSPPHRRPSGRGRSAPWPRRSRRGRRGGRDGRA